MDIRDLRYFLAVAREGNITRAAESLHIAQPSLSKQLMELEKELGKQLLIRGKRKITLTEEGVLLRKRAEEIVDLAEKTEHEISYDLGETMGDIYIGGSSSESVISAASSLRKKFSGIRFHFFNGDATDVAERLEHGSLDFAIMLEPVDNVKYDFLSLPDSSEWGILAKSDDPLAKKKYVTQEEMKSIPLIMHRRPGLQNEIAHWAETNVENLHIAATYNIVHGNPIPYVTHELGYFLTTKDLLAPTLAPEVCFLPLKPQLPTKLALVWKKHAVLNSAAKAFYKSFFS
ncbi:MAG: LysR family transcriptional regulator [Roseburia sp.]|nr:LysR family transcriptional regulator [Roseburia sp.]MDY5883160.1 LysR family transcriptional regulator [Roseburia sp.]